MEPIVGELLSPRLNNKVSASFTIGGFMAEKIVLTARDIHKKVDIIGLGLTLPGGSLCFVDEWMT
jgi:hypothetical protein